jgi:replicative DNA helicase
MKLPCDPESEIGIIGCCVMGGLETSIEAVETVSANAFMREDCKQAFEIIERLATDGAKIDVTTFFIAWRAKYAQMPEDLISAPDQIPSPASLPDYVAVVNDMARRRNLMQSASILLNKAGDRSQNTDEIVSEAESILGGEEIKSVKIIEPKEAVSDFVDYLEERFNSKGAPSGILTGYRKLDYLTDGLQYGEQTLIAARPSVGKTAIAMNIVEEVCFNQGIPTLFVTLEMRPNALLRRLVSSAKRIRLKDIRGGTFSQIDFQKLTAFNSKLKQTPLYIINAIGGIDCNRLSAAIRRMVRKHGIKLVVVDYLQKIKAADRNEKRTYEVGQVSTVLKSTADSTKTAFLTLCQLNRESDKEKGRVPKLSDLADSGQIERDADTVCLLHRVRTQEDPDGRSAALIVAKQRDGELGTVQLHYDGEFCRFENDNHHEPSSQVEG